MGVRGLQTYLENYCAPACIEVSIPQLINSYKIETGNQYPVIVVDGSSCLQPLYGDLEWVTGGQMKQYVENLTCFVDKFKNLGVKLVFFFDGPPVIRKIPTWIKRRISNMYDVYKTLDYLALGNKSTRIDKRLRQLPAGITAITHKILKDQLECEVYMSVMECDEEIVAYAKKIKCFAILGQDSDYLIYEGDHYYLSILHFDMNTMKTIYYNRYALANRLHISLEDLPLLATLIGNDIVSSEELQTFHRVIVRLIRGKYAKPQYHVLFPCVAEYIRRLPKGAALLNSLPDISHYVFGTRSKVDLILTSLQSYSSVEFHGPERSNAHLGEWDRILNEAKFRHMTNNMPSSVYSVLHDLPNVSSTLMEDYRCTDLRSSASVLRPLRQRIYGILLQEKPSRGSVPVVRELMMEGPKSLDEEKLVTIVPPKAHHPGLLTLWMDETESVNNIKWTLLISTISMKLETEKVKCLPERLILPALIVCYLTEEKALEEWEIDAIVATAVVLEQYNTERLAKLPPDPVSIRAIRIAPLILRSGGAINNLSVACGNPLNQKYMLPNTYFDGKLFQLKYQAAEKKVSLLELCDKCVNYMEDFQKVKCLVSAVV